MTRAQLRVLQFISAHISQTGVPPSFDEIAAHVGLKSKSGVHKHIAKLVAAGNLTFVSNRARSTGITVRGQEALRRAGEISVALPHDVRVMLKRYASQSGASEETIIREAVRAYVGAAA